MTDVIRSTVARQVIVKMKRTPLRGSGGSPRASDGFHSCANMRTLPKDSWHSRFALLSHYIDANAARNELFDLGNYVFSDEMSDPDVIAAFNAQYQTIPDNRDPLEVMISASKHGLTRSDWKLLKELTVDQLVTIFKRAKSNTRRVIRACLDAVPANPGEPAVVPQRARKALVQIGRESLVNRIRVKRFGITDAELESPTGERTA